MAIQPPPRREGHPYYMYDSIIQQPDAIERVIKEEETHVKTLSVALSNADAIHIVGIGMYFYYYKYYYYCENDGLVMHLSNTIRNKQ